METNYYSCELMELDLDDLDDTIIYDPESSLEDENDYGVQVQGITFQFCY